MRNVFMTLAASALLIGAASMARAADAIDEVPAAPESQDVVDSTTPGWEGAYIGGKLTEQRATVKDGKNYNANGLGGGLYGGYNLQSDKIVYGAEADLNYSGVDSETRGVTTKQKLNGSLRGRIGYDLDPVLVYGTAGITASGLKAEDKTSSDSNTLVGLAVGAGVEGKVTDSIIARGEYRFTEYQSQTFKLDSGARDRGLKEHSLSLGLGVRF
jgi:outer membrane immunogenic protein